MRLKSEFFYVVGCCVLGIHKFCKDENRSISVSSVQFSGYSVVKTYSHKGEQKQKQKQKEKENEKEGHTHNLGIHSFYFASISTNRIPVLANSILPCLYNAPVAILKVFLLIPKKS